MIDKRISYRFGGGYQGSSAGPVERGSSNNNQSQSGRNGGDRRDEQKLQQYTAPAPKPTPVYKEPDPVTEVVPGDKAFEPVKKYSPNIGPSLHGDMKEPEETLQEMIARQQKEKDEDFERDQDWNLIKDMSKKGYDFNEIQSAVEKGLTVKAPTTDRRQSLIDFGLRSIIPKTGLEKSLLSRMKSFVPEARTGVSSFTDRMGGLGSFFNPQKMITNFALNKMGLGFLNPILGIASLLGFNPFKNLGTKYAGVPLKKSDIPTDKDGPSEPEKVMKASIKKFQPTDQQTAQMNEIMRKRMILQGYADKGSLNERGMNTLTQMNNLISQYQADPRSIYG